MFPITAVTFEQVRDAIAISLSIDLREIFLSSSLASLGADSMDKAQLILDLEDALGVELPDDDAQKFFTVQSILDYVNDPRSKRL